MQYRHTAVYPSLCYAVDYSWEIPPAAGAIAQIVNGTGQSMYGDSERILARYLCGQGIGSSLFSLRSLNGKGPVQTNGAPQEPCFETLGEIVCGLSPILESAPNMSSLKLCLIASGDGAAVALYAAATAPARISAMVISGGRPAPALSHAAKNTVPTLFIVGSDDQIALGATLAAHAAARGPKELSVIPRTGHLMREPGVLEEIAKQSAAWIRTHSDYKSEPAAS